MANTTNFGWETPDDTDLVKDGAAAMRTLGSAIDTSMADLKGGTTGQVLAKNSNTDMDFIWTTDATGIPATIVDAKGDLIAATAADTVSRLAVGTNNQVLTADSTASTGIKWADPVSGGMTLLSTTSLSGSSTTVSISGSGYIGLYITVTGFSMSGEDQTRLRFNGDTGSNYLWAGVRKYVSDAANLAQDTSTGLLSTWTPQATQTNSIYEIFCPNSQDTSAYKVGNFNMYGTRSTGDVIEGGQWLFKSTSVISSFNFSTLSGATFSSGSIKVYGVK